MLDRFAQPEGWEWGTMVNEDHVNLRYGKLAGHDSPIANIVMTPGFAEFGEKYFETARDLSQLGYNIYLLNWRGQGGSTPYLSDRFRRHSLGFDRDARDLIQFAETIVPQTGPRVLLAHSMGAMIGLLSLTQKTTTFRAVILTAPFLGFQNFQIRGLETIIARIPATRKFLERTIPGGHGWRRRDDPANNNKPHYYSSDPDRMALHDEWMQAKPELRVGSPTMGFVREASRAMAQLRKPDTLESVTKPTLVFTAGQDRVVRNDAIFNAVARMPLASHVHIDDARHEILLERDDIRGPVLKNIHNFLKARFG